MSLWGFIAHATLFSKLILFLLMLISVLSWAVIAERIRFFSRRKKAATLFSRLMNASGSLAALCRLSEHHTQAPAARMLIHSVEHIRRCHGELSDHSGGGLATQSCADVDLKPEEWERFLMTAANLEVESAEHYLSYLATVSTASPFIGLLGTVWGVMIAFLQIGSTSGQAMLEVVGPGIAEALIATVAGLATAIPASIAYNFFGAAARREQRELESLGTQVQLFLSMEKQK
jgi:biopolymer transport protein TolQ